MSCLISTKNRNYMNKHTLLAALCVVSLCTFHPAIGHAQSKADPFPFTTISTQTAQQRASTTGKNYLVFFTADWIMPCQWMMENTFTDVHLVDFTHKHYLLVKADIDQPATQALQQQYQVKALPCLLVFNARGQLLGKKTGAASAGEVLEWLQDYPLPSAPKAEMVLLPTPRPTLRLSRPALLPDAPAVATTARPAPPSPPAQQKKYTVQAGAYRSYENALRCVGQLEQRVSHPVRFVRQESKGEVRYDVWIGELDSWMVAADLQVALEKQGVSGFVRRME